MKTITSCPSAMRRILLCAMLMLGAARAMAGSNIYVSTTVDEDKADGEMSLREALDLANGNLGRSITDEEKARVDGGSFLRDPKNPFTRWIVNPVNGNVGSSYGDTIRFLKGVGEIQVTSQLPDLGNNDNIEGLQPDGGPITSIDGNGCNADGIYFSNTNNVHITNLIIHDFGRSGIHGSGVQHVTFQGLEIYKCGQDGIFLDGYNASSKHNSRDNLIGGTGTGQANQIYNNGQDGIHILNDTSIDQYGGLNNTIAANFIGLRSDLVVAGNKRNGIMIENAHGNVIGGDTAAEGNLIADNKNDGIHLEGTSASFNTILSNRLGVNAAATGVLSANAVSAIALVAGAGANDNNLWQGNQIGEAGKENYIGGAGRYGIFISDANTKGNIIGSNFICTNDKGTNLGSLLIGIGMYFGTKNNTFMSGSDTVIGNCQVGIDVTGASNVISNCAVGIANGMSRANGTGIRIYGGATTNTVTNNTISGNTGDGILISGATTKGNIVTANIIGLSENSQAAVGNNVGIRMEAGTSKNAIGAANKGNTIAGNASHGIYIKDATTTDNKVVCNKIGLNAPLITNGGNGILIENSALNQIGTTTEGGNIIVRNYDGIQITGTSASGNKVYTNLIGLSTDLATSASNRASGVSLLAGANNNEIGGSASNTGNALAGNLGDGIYISDSGTTGNKIYRNAIGTTPADSSHVGNGGIGVGIYNSASGNFIGGFSTVGNVISGNHDLGIDLGKSSGNFISGNKIGTNAAGSAALANLGGGIRLTNGSANNSIGGSLINMGNVISGNKAMGVGIYNPGSTGNSIVGNVIGLDATAAKALGNASDGVVIQEGAASNLVRSNTIAGNKRYGVSINGSGTTDNTLGGNAIGTNFSGGSGLGNNSVGVMIAGGAKTNKVGDNSTANIISNNFGVGVEITDSGTDGNTVTNCIIGLTPDKSKALSSWQAGVAIAGGARSNVIGAAMSYASNRYTPSNYIAGNGGFGVVITDTGSNNNIVQGNFIGTNDAFASTLGNTAGGVIVENGAAHNTIGGSGNAFNMIVANRGPGVQLCLKNTINNTLIKNQIGCTLPDSQGKVAALGNAGGVRVYGGASLNVIGDSPFTHNVISGNSAYGVSIEDSATTGVVVMGNRIGLTPDGLAAMPNQGNGVTIKTGANRCTLIYNTISGNQQHGVELTNTTTYGNVIELNNIGTQSNGSNDLGNGGHGVRISGAHDNTLGSTTTLLNVIAYNKRAGVCVAAGAQNQIRCNAIHSNGGLGIDLGEDGVTRGGAVSPTGPNTLINYPVQLGLNAAGTDLAVSGFLANNPGGSYTVDLYASDAGDPSGHGEGQSWIGAKSIYLDATGVPVMFTVHADKAYARKVITATVTDGNGNTSEFSQPTYNAAAGWRGYR